ncbi:unnamed protein product [Haemonchus placei]|uniref:Uncharacterized protein n=1 Tax=Haemonchus placei TaxID=6290 RepID=A0A0N4WAW7_HAEPC|nr:unnamed protein product [Haemonchus placei]
MFELVIAFHQLFLRNRLLFFLPAEEVTTQADNEMTAVTTSSTTADAKEEQPVQQKEVEVNPASVASRTDEQVLEKLSTESSHSSTSTQSVHPAPVASRADVQVSETLSTESSQSSTSNKRPSLEEAAKPLQSPRVSDEMHEEGASERKVEKRSLSGEGENSNEAPKKKRRVRVRANRTSVECGDDYGTGIDDDRYATWLPPDDQSGDGKTALNAKFEGRY